MNKEITIIFYNDKGVKTFEEKIETNKDFTIISILTYANLMCENKQNMESYKIIF